MIRYFSQDKKIIPFKEFPYTIDMLFSSSDLVYRDLIEENNLYLQLVSYTFIFNPEKQKAFIAKRISGDKRLRNYYCLGFGGHVSDEDIIGEYSSNFLENAAIRELREELSIRKKELNLEHLGYIRDINSNTSNHLGAFYLLEAKMVSVIETNKLKGFWVSYDDLKNVYYNKLESWSKHALDYLYDNKESRKKLNF